MRNESVNGMGNVSGLSSFIGATAGVAPIVHLLLLLLLLLRDDGFLYDRPILDNIGFAKHVDEEWSSHRHCLLPFLSRAALCSRLATVLFSFLS